MATAKFTVSHCTASVGNQRSPSPNRVGSVTKRTYGLLVPDARGSKLRAKAQRRHSTSLKAVRAANDEKRGKFVTESQETSRMLSLSRMDQLIAATMLVEESYRFCQLHKTKIAIVFKDLLSDVGILMLSDAWDAPPRPDAPAEERHPYLFTVSEVNKLGLFTRPQ